MSISSGIGRQNSQGDSEPFLVEKPQASIGIIKDTATLQIRLLALFAVWLTLLRKSIDRRAEYGLKLEAADKLGNV